MIPTSRALGEAKSDAHQSSGMRSRCPHLRAAAIGAPSSEAIAPGVGQSLTIARNELIGDVVASDMSLTLGQVVLKSKAVLSHELGGQVGDNPDMPDRMSETEEKLAFINRVKMAREARYPTQRPMLTILGLDQGTYKQYETRTPLPMRYLPKFCAATGVTLEWLLTGEGEGVAEPAPVQKPVHMRKKRRRAA